MYKDIQEILNSHLSRMPDLPIVVWENTVQEITENDTYFEVHLLPASNFYPEIGDYSLVKLSGIYQINVITPKGIGWGNSANLVDKIIAHFPRNLVLTNGTVNVKIKQVDVAQGLKNEDGAYVVPVSIRYFSYYK